MRASTEGMKMFLFTASLLSIQVGMTTGRPVGGKKRLTKIVIEPLLATSRLSLVPTCRFILFIERHIRGKTTNNAKIWENVVADVPTRKTFY